MIQKLHCINKVSLNTIYPLQVSDFSQRVSTTQPELIRNDLNEEQKYADEAIHNDNENECLENNRFETLNKLTKKLERRHKIEYKWSDLLSMMICK